ncbi:3-hydroxyacyl-CoA dehydrogenase family protein [Oceanobacillus sp. APA_J-2(6-2)]|nr:3-hydroxyacyl-CoA dehydrogenase family protein [Oceanobacillus alkalisoli]
MVKDPTLEKLAVIGTGTMGHSIALSIALADMEVTMIGLDDADVKKGENSINEKLDILMENEVISPQEKIKVQNNISTPISLKDALADKTFVIEAAPENLEFKQELYKEIEGYCDRETILASNTSSLKPSDISKDMIDPNRMLVTHFWNPAHLVPLVEIVKNKFTKETAVDRAVELMQHIGKYPIKVEKEVLGFVGNRLQYALFREAQYLLEEGVATVEDIDAAIQMSIGRRLGVTGPFLTADMGGLDVFSSISDYIFPDLSNDSKSLPNLVELIDSSSYGQKNGKGYYVWDEKFHKEMNNKREKELIRWYKEDFKNSPNG